MGLTETPNFTMLPNSFIENIYHFSGAAVKIYNVICRKTIGWHKTTDRISYSQLFLKTGLATNSLRKGIKELVASEWIVQTGNKNSGYVYDLNLTVSKIDIELYQKLTQKKGKLYQKLILHNKEEKEKLNKDKNLNGEKKEFCNTILAYLTEVTKKSRQLQLNASRESDILSRAKEGAVLDDFKKVIDAKHNDQSEWWKENYAKYMTPETLFRQSKFWKYREEWRPTKKDEKKKLFEEISKEVNEMEIQEARIG